MAKFDLLTQIYEGLAPLWVEISFLFCFIGGFAFLRLDAMRHKKPKTVGSMTAAFGAKLKKVVETEAASGGSAAVLKAWRAESTRAPTPQDLLKSVVQAFLDAEPSAASSELVAHLQDHATLRNATTAAAILDIVARAGRTEVMMELWSAFQATLGMVPTCAMYEILLGGFASVGDEGRVEETFKELQKSRVKLSARGYSLTIKGFLKNGKVDAVLARLLQMRGQSLPVPPFAVVQFLRIAGDAGRLQEVFPAVEKSLELPPEAVSLLLEDACRRGDMDFAKKVERCVREAKQPLPGGAYDPLLKLCTLQSDPRALELFREMQEAGVRVSEGLCVGLLARCAETKFLRFAEEVVRFAQARKGMTIAIYSALMKVYAYCGMYDKACGLYDQIRADGLEPDAMMYGCLMKFSVECGRTDLSRELSEKAPSLDIHNYMTLIRAANRDRDVDRAFSVLAKLRETGAVLDVAAYNCVLDVCVSAGEMGRARELVREMKEADGLVDIITYNTLIKGYCQSGDLRRARELLAEMQAEGHPPNDVSYNCLLNAAVSRGNGNLTEAWETIDAMEKSGVAVDHYTVSIMMKAMKKARHPAHVAKALALLDRSGIDICSDEVLLNTVLETCTRHRELHRLEGILASYRSCSLRPQAHTYGSLIKACGCLKRVDKCWALWQEMEELRCLEPNEIVLGCMLDALVCNGRVDDAADLFSKLKGRVKPNTVIYSTLIKGFANTHQADKAMAAWKEMREAGIQMNTVVYNALIDAQARVGATEEVAGLRRAMERDGCPADGITYSTTVKSYCIKGDLDRALEEFRYMQRNGMAEEPIIYNTMLDGCARHGRFDLADSIWEDMERYRVIPSNFTLGILVKMYGKRRQLDKAFDVVESLPRRHGFATNTQVSTCLMCACLNNGATDRAFQVFEDLKRSSKGADAKAYSALISGCVRQNRLGMAQQLVEEAYGLNGSRPCPGALQETDPVEQLLKAYAQRGLMEQQGTPLLESLRVAKVPINSWVFSSTFGHGAGAQCGAAMGGQRRRGGGGGGGGKGFRAARPC